MTEITQEKASEIQSRAAKTGKNTDFARRAQSAAARHSGKK